MYLYMYMYNIPNALIYMYMYSIVEPLSKGTNYMYIWIREGYPFSKGENALEPYHTEEVHF